MVKFDNTLYVVPQVVKSGQKDVELEWQIAEGGDMIEEIVPGCGCTAEVTVHSDRVVAKYTDATPSSEIEKMPGKLKTVSKNLRVFLKDGKPLKVKNSRGVEALNPDKQSVTLFFHVNVAP